MTLSPWHREASRPTTPVWHVPACAACGRSIVRVWKGKWTHITDFSVGDTDHMPTPVQGGSVQV